MKLDPKLNIVVPVETEGGTVYVHSMPIRREVFERFFEVIAKAFSDIYSGGTSYALIAGTRVAALTIRKIAAERGEAEDVEKGLFAEIRRLTNVLTPGERGWETLPFDEATQRKVIDGDDVREVENALAFFMLESVMHGRVQSRVIIDEAAKLWGAQTTSLNCTEFCTSLPTSIATVNTGETARLSSIPS